MKDAEIPQDVPGSDEEPPDFGDWDSPEAVMKDAPIRERLLDVIVGTREPTKVAVIAERADCDTETARDYLEWFASMGIVREHAGRPVKYERNESYLFWRRVEEIRREYSDEEIVDELAETEEAITAYRERFETDDPDAVSLVETDGADSVETAWEAVSEWKTLEQRARLLDTARRDDAAGSSVDRINA